MDLRKLAADIMQRYSQMDEKDQLALLLELSRDDIVVFLLKDFDEIFRKECHGLSDRFFHWLETYNRHPNMLGAYSRYKKWGCINKTVQEFYSANHLIEFFEFSCCPLIAMMDPKRGQLFGYSLEEAKEISKILLHTSGEEKLDAWEAVILQ